MRDAVCSGELDCTTVRNKAAISWPDQGDVKEDELDAWTVPDPLLDRCYSRLHFDCLVRITATTQLAKEGHRITTRGRLLRKHLGPDVGECLTQSLQHRVMTKEVLVLGQEACPFCAL